jgi:hypothetical protein
VVLGDLLRQVPLKLSHRSPPSIVGGRPTPSPRFRS